MDGGEGGKCCVMDGRVSWGELGREAGGLLGTRHASTLNCACSLAWGTCSLLHPDPFQGNVAARYGIKALAAIPCFELSAHSLSYQD